MADIKTNPFPVYPVSSLADIAATIEQSTVETGAIRVVKSAVDRHVAGFTASRDSSGPDNQPPTIITVRGDYGTGKTHLLLYARSRFEQMSQGRSVVVAAAATESDYVQWFSNALGPALRRLRLGALVTELLAAAAKEVALRTRLTAHHAATIAEDPAAVFPLLRHGTLAQTEVERAFLRRIEQTCPSGSAHLRKVLLALPWADSGPAAERWLTGARVDNVDYDLLGVERDLEPETEAATLLASIAGICLAVNRPFGLFIDEFEHFVAVDVRNGTRRNATWIKRLLESLVPQSSFVCIAGHWTAWNQLPDFYDRLGSAPPVSLVALTPAEVREIATSFAEDWTKRWHSEVAETIAEGARGNIRYIMAVLYQLYEYTSKHENSIKVEHVRRAIRERLRNFGQSFHSEQDVEAFIMELVPQYGGNFQHNPSIDGISQVDFAIYRDNYLRLLVQVKRVPTRTQLLRTIERFTADLVRVRHQSSAVKGMLIVLGATDHDIVTLTNRTPGLYAIRAELDEAKNDIDQIVMASMANPGKELTERDEDRTYVVRSSLSESRQQSEIMDEENTGRLKKYGASNARASAIASAIISDIEPDWSPNENHERTKSRIIDTVIKKDSNQEPKFLAYILGSSTILSTLLILLGLSTFFIDLSSIAPGRAHRF